MDREASAEARRRHFEQATLFGREGGGPEVSSLLIKNIGEFFTGDITRPQAQVGSLLVRDGRIAAFDPPEPIAADGVLDAGGSAVMPGLVDGHIHPVLGEWTPTQDTQGWIGNYVHGGTPTMTSARPITRAR